MPLDLTKPLYKYTYQKYVEDILNDGIFRIGTLYDFRKEENHGDEIGDTGEGTKNLYYRSSSGPTVLDTENPELFPEFLQERILVDRDSGNRLQIVARDGISQSYNNDNCYVLCLSDTFDRNTMRQLGYDACIRIDNPKRFIDCISNSIRKLAKFELVDLCEYQGRTLDHKLGRNIPPVLLKDSRHSYQREVRIVWKAQHKNIKHIVKAFVGASQYCSLKNNELITVADEFHLEVERRYRELLYEVEGRKLTDFEINHFTSVMAGAEKGEVIYLWKDKAFLTFGQVRNGRFLQTFIHETHFEKQRALMGNPGLSRAVLP